MGLYIGHMRKCCRLSALLTIIDYSPDTQQRPLSLSLFLFHTISLCVSVYWWGRRQWLSVLWWLGEQQAYGEVRQGTARPLCLLWPTRYTPLKENQSHHTTDTYPPPFLLSSLCSSPLFYPHTQTLYKMLLLDCSLLSLHSSPYLMCSVLKATWLTLWSKCVFKCCMHEFFSLIKSDEYKHLRCRIQVHSWAYNFCFLHSCFDVYSLVLNETHANLVSMWLSALEVICVVMATCSQPKKRGN